MHINQLKNEANEVDGLKQALKRTYLLCQKIYDYRDYIEQIKSCLESGDDLGAGELWNEIPTADQQILIIAPSKGGPFSTQERAQVKALWKLSEEDLTNRGNL